jgi:diguanylate cyclase (GGDEF)-like protein
MDPQAEASQMLHILDVGRRMAETRSFSQLLIYVVDEAMQLVGAERGGIVRRQPDGDLIFPCFRDRDGNLLDSPEREISLSVVGEVLRSGQPVILRDASNDPRYSAAQSVRELRLRSIMCVPLISYGTPIGAIYVESRSIKGRFHDSQLVPLALFAGQAAIALEHATRADDLESQVVERTRALNETLSQLEREVAERRQMEVELRRLATRDPLTDLLNRRSFFEQAGAEWSRAMRHDTGLTAMMVDIDHFKQINDSHGHAVGDAALQQFAALCRQNLRGHDLVGRLGGEEFGVLLPQSDSAAAALVAERLLRICRATAFDVGGAQVSFTISIGVAERRPVDTTIDQLLVRADRALYAAKHAGRDQIVADLLA